jgi:hypothetical protein
VQALVRGQAELGLVRPSHLNLNYLNQFPVKNHPTALAFPDPLKVLAEKQVQGQAPIFSEVVTKTLLLQVQAVAEQLQVQGLAEKQVPIFSEAVTKTLVPQVQAVAPQLQAVAPQLQVQGLAEQPVAVLAQVVPVAPQGLAVK